MTPHLRYGLIGVVIGLILFWINPILAIAVIAVAIGVPIIAYRMLSPEQRRRLRRARDRKQLGG
jgi:Flp pilus assembly protein TadB